MSKKKGSQKKGSQYEGLQSPEYWAERMKELDKMNKLSEDKQLLALEKAYRKAMIQAKKDLLYLCSQYGINASNINDLINPRDRAEYLELLKELEQKAIDTDNIHLLQRVESLKARDYITKQIALIDSIDIKLCEVTEYFQMNMEEYLLNVFNKNLSHIGNMFDFKIVIPKGQILEVINYPWSGRQFSDRIWSNKDRLINAIKEEFVVGLINGDDYYTLASKFADKLGVMLQEAERLIRTETNYTANQSYLKGFEELGIEKGTFHARLDSRTSTTCKDLDGEVIDLKTCIVGKDYPPLHPYCRSVVIPII